MQSHFSASLFCQIVTHINKEYGVDLDVEVSLPKIKGNFKGSHTAVFEARNARVIPMSQEESVEDMFRSLAEKKTASAAAEKKEATGQGATIPDPDQRVLSGYMEKDGRGRFSTWNKR